MVASGGGEGKEEGGHSMVKGLGGAPDFLGEVRGQQSGLLEIVN